jgi:hypothetical protein
MTDRDFEVYSMVELEADLADATNTDPQEFRRQVEAFLIESPADAALENTESGRTDNGADNSEADSNE